MAKHAVNIDIYVDNYEAPQKLKSEETDIEKWLNGSINLRGFSLFRNELAHMISADESIQQEYKTKLDGSKILIDGEAVDDEQLLNLWRIIQASGIIQMEEAKNFAHMPTLLKLMNVIDRTKMVYASKNGEFELLPNAYQYIP